MVTDIIQGYVLKPKKTTLIRNYDYICDIKHNFKEV